MQDEATTAADVEPKVADKRSPGDWRGFLRDQALQAALRKRTTGVPTYSVPEAAALLSISQEYLYRLIQAGGFPVLRMRLRGNQGRYVVSAEAIEKLLNDASSASSCLDVGEWTKRWQTSIAGGAA